MRSKNTVLTIFGGFIAISFWAHPGFSQVKQVPRDIRGPEIEQPKKFPEPSLKLPPTVMEQQAVSICPRQMGMQSRPNGRISFVLGASFQVECSGLKPALVSDRRTLVWDRQDMYSLPGSDVSSFQTSFPIATDATESAMEALLLHALANQKMVRVEFVTPIGGGPARVSEFVVQEDTCGEMASRSPIQLAVHCNQLERRGVVD
jgi:hypothetical protein